MDSPPVAVTVMLYGWTAGESEIRLSIPDESDLGRRLGDASPAEQNLLYGRLLRHTIAELVDGFKELETPMESVASILPRRKTQ